MSSRYLDYSDGDSPVHKTTYIYLPQKGPYSNRSVCLLFLVLPYSTLLLEKVKNHHD